MRKGVARVTNSQVISSGDHAQAGISSNEADRIWRAAREEAREESEDRERRAMRSTH